MQSECMVCHCKIQRGQKCQRCVTILDPNNPLQARQKRETVKCEYCNQDIFLEDFDLHDNNCESKKIIQQCYLEEMREREEIRQRQNHRHHQQQQQRATSNRIREVLNPNLNIFQYIRHRQLDGLGNREEQEPIHVHEINNVIRALHLLNLRRGHQHQNQIQDNDLIKIKYQPSQQLSEENKKCMICLSDYEPNEELILLQCAHRFHSECIKDWLKKSVKCPICRHNLQQS